MDWNTETLRELAASQSAWEVDVKGDCLNITSDEGVEAYIYVGNRQIIAETTLFPAALVTDTTKLNDLILRTHNLLPLTTICINTIGDEEFYTAFGSLSVDSDGIVIVEEIETLFANVGEFLELYKDHLKKETAA